MEIQRVKLKILSNIDSGNDTTVSLDHFEHEFSVPLYAETDQVDKILARQSVHLTALNHMRWACGEILRLLDDPELGTCLVELMGSNAKLAAFESVVNAKEGRYRTEIDLPRIARKHFGSNELYELEEY